MLRSRLPYCRMMLLKKELRSQRILLQLGNILFSKSVNGLFCDLFSIQTSHVAGMLPKFKAEFKLFKFILNSLFYFILSSIFRADALWVKEVNWHCVNWLDLQLRKSIKTMPIYFNGRINQLFIDSTIAW